MRRGRILAASTAVALAATGLAAAAAGAASTSGATTTSSGAKTSYVVLTDTAAHASSVAAQLKSAGNTVTSVNKAIGLISVTSTKSNFAASAKGISGVKGVSAEHSVGYAPQLVAAGPDPVEKEHVFDRSRPNGTGKYIPPPPPGHDPLDGLLWGMEMINAFDAHATETGDERVTVGVLDTGIQGDHPDLAPNFDAAKSRNFTTDMEDIDGDNCEYTGCVDPSFVDNNGHGTHVAGTIGAALNGIGVSGVAPDVTLVNIRGGQDSGFFFLGPTVNALTYAGDIGIDVVNMSFYVDPWLYNCEGGAPEDSDAAAANQDVIIEGMNRALTYAHNHGVSLVGSLGNDHDDISNPRHDFSSPDYNNPDFDWDNDTYERTIDNDTCFDLPVEGPFVIGVSALGPSGMKADYSNYASDLTSGELEVSAPGGYYRDGYGTKSFRTRSNLILSTAPTNVLLAEGLIDKKGKITNDGKAVGVLKQCNDAGVCGYYQWLQGTSMASPHAVGVAALAVSAHGVMDSVASRGLTMAPTAVTSLLQSTATDHACPVGVVDYTIVGRSAEYNATCTGTPAFNSFYGAGIVNALGVVQ